MRTILPLLWFLIVTSSTLAQTMEEDILRPRIPTQGRVFIGFDIGMNTTWFDGNPIYRAFFPSEEESRMFRSAFGFEPYASVYVGMRLSPAVHLRARADYDVRTADRSGSTVDSCPLLDATTGELIRNVPVSVDKEYHLSISYLTFSLVGEYHSGQLFFFFGPSIALPLRRSFIETDQITDTSSICIYFSDTPDASHRIRAEVSGTDNLATVIGVKVGAGYEIPMSADLSLVPQIAIDYPLGSALEADEPFAFRADPTRSGSSITTRLNEHMYFRLIQASLGLRYSF